MGGQLGFIFTQITYKPKELPSENRLDNQTALVTGANVGVGFECARQLVSQHGIVHLILGVRDIGKGDAAKREIETMNSGCKIDVWPLDLESFDSIAAFAKRANALDRLDVALLNAAIKQLRFVTSCYGHESNIQVNHLGTSLLSLLLLPVLRFSANKRGTPSRLTFTSSEAHFWASFKERSASNILEYMDQKDSFTEGDERYNASKLLNVFWFRELATKVDPSEIIINGSHPGFCSSQLHRHDQSAGFKILTKLLAWTPKEGAYLVLDAAVTKSASSHGAYIQEQKITQPSKFVLSDQGREVQTQLWVETVRLLKKECPEVDLDDISFTRAN